MKNSRRKNDPVISVVIPVFHEAKTIHKTIEALLNARDNALEIIVVDADPENSTISSIRQPGILTAMSEKGRAEQMNKGASLASGDILLFLHADTLLPTNGLAEVRAAIVEKRCKTGAFRLGIASSRWVFRITEQYVALRTRLTRIPFGDQAIFMRRDYFQTIGGYRKMPLMEDVELMSRIKKRGDVPCIIPDQVLSSARRWEHEGVFFCTFRNWALQLGYCLGVSPERLARWYR